MWRGLAVSVMAINLGFAIFEFFFIIFGVTDVLQYSKENPISTLDVTSLTISALLPITAISLYALCLTWMICTNRANCLIYVTLVFFPAFHVVNAIYFFIRVNALFAGSKARFGLDRPASNLQETPMSRFTAYTGIAIYAIFFVYSGLAWFVLFREMKRRKKMEAAEYFVGL